MSAWNDLAALHGLIDRTVDRESESLSRPRGAGRWTLAETVLHAILVSESIAGAFLTESDATEGVGHADELGSWSRTWLQLSHRMPNGLRSPEAWEPRVILGEAALLDRSKHAKLSWESLLGRPDQGGSARIPHLGLVQRDEALEFALIHARHHLSRKKIADYRGS